MNKIVLASLSVFLFSTSYAYEINFSKKFSKTLMPDILSAGLTIRIQGDNEEDISSKLEVFNEKIKANSQVAKKLGTFNIHPNFKYSSNNSPKIIDYIGQLKYTIESRNAKDINNFITSINSVKRSRKTSISVSGLSWKVKEDSYNVALDVLRLEAIYWIESHAKNLSKDLNKKCEVKNINISSYNNPRAYSSARMMSSPMSKSIPVPQANNQSISINPSYKVECK